MKATIGRNGPCPCGSGRKYKRCCLDGRTSGAASYDHVHETCSRAVLALERFCRKDLGGKAVSAACADYGSDPEGLADHEMQLFMPWMLYHWRPNGGSTSARRCLDRTSAEQEPAVREYIEAALAAPLSFHEVLAVERGRGVRVRDLLTGRERFVHERRGSSVLRRWHIVFGKVLDVAGLSCFDGVGSTPLAPGEREPILRAAREILGACGPVEPADLLPHHRALLDVYRGRVQRVRDQPPPWLVNTDGEDLILGEDHYRVAAEGRDEVARRLAGLSHVKEDEGERGTAVFVWWKPGNAQHKSWDNTTLGRAVVGAGDLVLHTNSRERAARFRRMVESACGDLVDHARRKEQDANVLAAKRWLAPKPERERKPRRARPPEEAEILQDFLDRHYAAWPDEPIPSLGGRTPREAARTPDGRAKVEALVREMEFHQDGAGEMLPYDFGRLRRELGLAIGTHNGCRS